MVDASQCIDSPGGEIALLAGMSRALGAMMHDIEAAQRRIWIESYIVRDDKLGRRLIDALARAHDRGVDVRLLFDALGSENMPRRFLHEARTRGIDARPYRRVRPFWVEVFPRDHARIVLVDDVGYTGGSAWGDEWLPESEGGKGWHDVLVRMEGDCIADLEAMFEQVWTHYDSDTVCSETVRERHGDLVVVSDFAGGAAALLEEHVRNVSAATSRIWIENAYFFPPRRLLKELVAARARGVDVRVLVPGKTDLPAITRAARGEYAKWLRAGLRIFEYGRTVMHSKIAVIDDAWCTVGTFNMNPTSVACVHELNVVVHDPRFVARVAAQIERDIADARPVTLEDVAGWSLVHRLVRGLYARALRVIERLLDQRVPRLLWATKAPVRSSPTHESCEA